MGVIILAKCKCGFEQEVFADRGKVVSGTTCFAPALCEKCNKIITINYADINDKCPDCSKKIKFYNNIELQKKSKDTPPAISWGMDIEGDFILPQAFYKCPSCGEFSLEFAKVGNWD